MAATIMSNRFVALLSALTLASAVAACATENDGLDSEDITSIEESSWGDLASRPSVELWKGTDGQFRFHLLEKTQEVVFTSQGYSSRTSALNGLLSVLENGKQASQYTVNTAANGGSYFNLLAANKAVIATGEVHTTAAAAQADVQLALANVTGYQKAWDTATGARFAIKQDAAGQWYFNLHARNGAIQLTSQKYGSKASALNGAFSTAENGLSKTRYTVQPTASGTGYYFNVTATNGQVVATSEVYASKQSAERGRDNVITLLPVVPLL
ncbi:MAG TPA: YegP family protein [Kofleriaceae bacterium]|nr:YegP family protein [Kofleriaceae bacterium]